MKNNIEEKPVFNENDFKEIITSMAGIIDNQNIELYKKLSLNNNFDIKNKKPENFYYKYLYPFERYIRGLIQTEISANKDIEFIYKNYKYINYHFTYWIARIEGSYANADKASTIINKIVDFYQDGTPIEFDYSGEYTYHLPKIIFTTHDEIIKFYKSITSLYYGNAKEYMNCSLELSNKGNNNEK